MAQYDFRRYPEMAYLLMRERPGGREEFRIYMHRTFALNAAELHPYHPSIRPRGIVFELPLPALNTLKVVEA